MQRGRRQNRWAPAGWFVGVALAMVAAPGMQTRDVRAAGAMFRGGALHQGVAEGVGVENLGGIAWRFETGAAVRSSPVIWDETLYVGSSDARLYALDAASGREVWRFEAGAAVTSTAAVDAERVVFADRNNTVYALVREDGGLLWQLDTGDDLPLPWGHEGWDYFTASPTLVGELVLIGSGDGKLYALDATTGSKRWSFDSGARIRTTPTVADGAVLFGNSAGIFHALDLGDGSLRWRFESAGHTLSAADVGFDRRQIYSSAAVHEGVAYFGSRDAQLYALDIADGSELWRSGDGTSAWVISSPAVHAGRVYSARSSSTAVRALDAADGAEIWKLTTGGAVFASPVIAGDTVYVANGAGWIMALATADGSLRWRYRTGGGVWGTPLVAGDRLYVGSDDGHVYALAHTDGPAPKRAVYWQEEGIRFSSLGLGAPQRRILRYFEQYGYETLSADTLGAFLRARIDDLAPSVVVFAMDHVPDEVIEGDPQDTLFRRFLDAGGKIVWMGAPPLFYVFDEAAGSVTGIDPGPSSELLGVDTSDFRSDVYPVRPTRAGRLWGLQSSWVGMGGFDDDEVDDVLAVDELGRAVCWVRGYGGAEGTGFVFVRPAFDARTLDEVRAVAEYGVMRTPLQQRRDE